VDVGFVSLAGPSGLKVSGPTDENGVQGISFDNPDHIEAHEVIEVSGNLNGRNFGRRVELDWSMTGCDLSPHQSLVPVGATHSLTITVLSGGMPAAGVQMTFKVKVGPNAGQSQTLATDSNGHAVYSYTGAGGPGTDLVVAEGRPQGIPVACSAVANWTRQSLP
jgi:hypothetical protein